MATKKTKGWNIDAQYRHYLKVVDKYEMEHDINKIHRWSKKEFRQKINTLREIGYKKINYKTDLVERQVFSELSKKSARKLEKIIKKDKRFSKAMQKYSAEKWGQKGIQLLSESQKKIVSPILNQSYENYRAQGLSASEAKKRVSHYWFGSPE